MIAAIQQQCINRPKSIRIVDFSLELHDRGGVESGVVVECLLIYSDEFAYTL